MPRWLQFIFYFSIVLIPAGWMTHLILAKTSINCEVCIEFKGKKDCRKASGPDQSQCQRTATDNACGLLAGGMTESIQCSNTAPKSVTFGSSKP